MADDVDAKVTIDTAESVDNVHELRDATKDAGTELGKLDDTDVKPDIDLDVDDSKIRSAGEAMDDLDTKSRKAGGGLGFQNSALSDLAGPLGDTASKAGELGDSFEGLGEIAGGLGSKLGLGEAAAESLGTAIAGIGVAVAAATLAWGLYKKGQEEAKQAAKDFADAQAKFIDGHPEEFVKTLNDQYKGTQAALIALGFTTDDFVATMRGQGDTIDRLKVQLGDLDTQYANTDPGQGREIGLRSAAYLDQRNKILDTISSLQGLSGAFKQNNTDAAAAKSQFDSLLSALQGNADLAADSVGRIGFQAIGATQNVRDMAAAAGEVDDKVADVRDQFAGLKDDILDPADAVEQLNDAFDKVQDAAIAAWDAAKSGAPDADRKMRDYQQSIRDATRLASNLGIELDSIPPETQAAIVATVARGDIDTARQLLADAAKDIPVSFQLDLADLDKQAAVARARLGGKASGSGAGSAPSSQPSGSRSGIESFGGTTNIYYPPKVTPDQFGRAQYDYQRWQGPT